MQDSAARACNGAHQGTVGAGAERAPKEWVAQPGTRKLLEELLKRSEDTVIDLAAAAAATPRQLTHGHVHVLVEVAGRQGRRTGTSKGLALARWLAFFGAGASVGFAAAADGFAAAADRRGQEGREALHGERASGEGLQRCRAAR